MAEVTVLLRGGSRNGESTRLDDGVTRLRAASRAPGLLDVYEATDEHVRLDGEEGEQGQATVYAFVAYESVEGLAPELVHAPPER